ncbi:MAG: leucine-rich repeat protein [Bacteroidales bacterium]|nr:leucine-rich repeat protein [Bacteroidales bacterium]
MKKLILPLLVAIFTAVQAFAYDFSAMSPSGHTLYYSYISKSDKTVELTYEISYSEPYETQPEGDLIIPATVENEGVQFTVISIGNSAFYNCKKIKSVVIQEGVTTIVNAAFKNCDRLQSVTLPESIVTIKDFAFSSCIKLQSINLPNSLTTIGTYAFSHCSSLESIIIPNSILIIEGYTFMGCTNLVSVTLPKELTKIKEDAFYSCENLKSITLPNSLTYIGEYAFYCTYAMTSISIPANVTEIGKHALDNPYLKNLFLNSTNPPYIEEDFVDPSYLPNIYVPCDALGNYQNDEDWELYKDYLKTTKHKVLLLSTDKHGYATIEAENMCDDEYEATLSVVYQSDYTFGGWSDGNKDNPRTITITKDTSFTALFGEKPQIENLEIIDPICTSATGSISFEVTNGVAPYTITWNDGGTGTSRSEMIAGTYYFYATDQEGFSSDTVFVTLYPRVDDTPAMALLPGNPICESSTGSITVIAMGGTEPYTYKWEKQEVVEEKVWNFDKNLQSIINDLDGTATLYGVHNFNNTSEYTKDELSLSDGGALESKRSIHVDISMDSVFAFKLELPFKNDYTPVYYDEDHEELYFEHYNEINLATNTYGLSFYHKGASLNLYVLDKDKNQSSIYSIPYHLDWTQIVIPWENLTQEDVTAIVFASSKYQYGSGKEFDFWIDEVSILMYDKKEEFSSECNLIDLTAGKYTLTLSDYYGCSMTQTVTLNKDFSQVPIVELTAVFPICETKNGSINIAVEGDASKYSFLWEDGSTQMNRNDLAAGAYSVTITDENGCSVSLETDLEKDFKNLPQVTIATMNPNCKTEDGQIYVEPVDEYSSYTYSWSGTNYWQFADFENGAQTNFGSRVKVYNDSELIDGNTVYSSSIANDGANGTSHSFQLSASAFTPGPYYGVDNAGFTLSLDNGAISLDRYFCHSLGMSFYHKGDACGVGIDNTSDIVEIPEHSDWTLVTIYWDKDLGIKPNIEEIKNISWSYRHEFSSKDEIQFQIDEVSLLLKLEAEEGENYKAKLPAETYLLSVSDEWGCMTEEIITLTVDESTMPIIHKETSNAICGHNVGEISISIENGSPYESYSWNDTEEIDLKRENLAPGTYIFTATNEYGCTASDTTEIEYESFKYQPEIALVTVSQESPANLVVWQKEETQAIDFYSIYRETSSANNYEKIADVPFNQTSIYLDENTDSQTKAYRYKISATDNCGYESPLSTNHKTINATASLGVGGVVNLIWDGYEGFEFSTYSIYRITKDDKKPVQPIDEVPSTNWTYVDKNAPENTLAYYVAVKLPKTIDVNEPFVKAESGPFILAISNIAEIESQGGTGISTVDGISVNVYGTNNAIVIENTGENQITICNAMGQTIVRAKGMNETKRSFNVENGIYIVIVGNKAFRVVVE